MFLSDGEIYSAQEFIEQLEVGGLRVRNAYLAGKPDDPRIELVGEGAPKPFEDSVRALFAEDNPQKQSFEPGPMTKS